MLQEPRYFAKGLIHDHVLEETLFTIWLKISKHGAKVGKEVGVGGTGSVVYVLLFFLLFSCVLLLLFVIDWKEFSHKNVLFHNLPRCSWICWAKHCYFGLRARKWCWKWC